MQALRNCARPVMAVLSFLVLALALSVAFAPGVRAEPTTFSCYAEASAGADIAVAKSGGTSVGETGFLVGPGLGCDLRIGNFVVGALGRYDWTNTLSSNGAWTGAGRFGYQVNQYVLPYVIVGITNADFDFGYGSKSTNALTYGLGLQVGLAAGVSGFLEWDRASYDAQTFGSPVNIRPDTDVIRVGVRYDLYGGSF